VDTTDLVPVAFESTNADGKDGLVMYWCPRSEANAQTTFQEAWASQAAEFVTWAFPDGSTRVTPGYRPAEEQPVVSRAQVHAWERGPISDEKFARLVAAVPGSSVPDAIDEVMAGLD